ncbi:efflux RND transporter periplasmic adaptor subunit [Porphyromonas sp. HMSC065F10]|uniref:efflux RND transporter periplasmic adaptor subunit n=1 Tax=Porphyromonas sp. HMSC065F10 TaxID=1739394 RepID=UPI0008D7ECE3|nr:efflux RND transporter periplasmic adaptor subunit [Porphyromonas sp. HMSC065F10]OFR36420.1 efflux transporter periplasmic adaptor subunit [Porphyromonas sp. HMSC065F10]
MIQDPSQSGTVPVQKKRAKKWPKILLWVVIGLAIIGVIATAIVKSQGKTKELYEEVTPTANDSIVKSTVLTGSIEPRDEILVKPNMNGIIAELNHLPGDFVQEGELIAKIQMVPDVAMVQSAASRVDAARVDLKRTEEVYKRDKSLYDQQILAKEAYETSLANYRRAKIEYSSAVEQLDLTRTGSSASTSKRNNTLVFATVTGTILEQPVKVGSRVTMANNFSEGTTVVSIADLTDLLFIGNVNESDVNNVTVGSPVTIHVGALKDKTYHAVVEYVSPKGKDTSGTILFEVKAAISGDDLSALKAGFSSNAEVEMAHKTGVLTIPEATVTYEGDKSFVFVKGGKGEYEKKEVTLGLSDGIKVEVLSGLTGDETLRGNLMKKKN